MKQLDKKLQNILNELGITLNYLSFSHNKDKLEKYFKDIFPISNKHLIVAKIEEKNYILINSNYIKTIRKVNFEVAKALAHITFNHLKDNDIYYIDDLTIALERKEDKEAREFAKRILMPEDMVHALHRKYLSFEDIIDNIFIVPGYILEERYKDLGYKFVLKDF